MKKTFMYLAGATVTAFTALAAIQSASATPITASGSFALVSLGATHVTPGPDITGTTNSMTQPVQLVTIVTGNFSPTISVSNGAAFNNQPIQVMLPVGHVNNSLISSFTLTVHGTKDVTFTFTEGHTDTLTPL